MTLAFQPHNDHVVLVVEEAKETSLGGILLPGSTGEKLQEAKVIAIGHGRYDEHNMGRVPMSCYVGERVLIHKHAGVEAKIDGQTVRIVKDTEVLGTFLKEVLKS